MQSAIVCLESQAYVASESVSLPEAGTAEPLAVALHATRRAGVAEVVVTFTSLRSVSLTGFVPSTMD